MEHSPFAGYKRCTKCDKVFRNYDNPLQCPFCKETKHTKDLFEEKNENNKT